jgi:hypothetical protein
MTTFLKRALVVALLTLAPMRAWAECAWLLWQEISDVFPHQIKSVRSWGVLVALETRTECEDMLMSMWQDTVDQHQRSKYGMKEVHSRRGFIEVIQKGQQGEFLGKTTYSFQCLPDAIDPRGPKASGQQLMP